MFHIVPSIIISQNCIGLRQYLKYLQILPKEKLIPRNLQNKKDYYIVLTFIYLRYCSRRFPKSQFPFDKIRGNPELIVEEFFEDRSWKPMMVLLICCSYSRTISLNKRIKTVKKVQTILPFLYLFDKPLPLKLFILWRIIELSFSLVPFTSAWDKTKRIDRIDWKYIIWAICLQISGGGGR